MYAEKLNMLKNIFNEDKKHVDPGFLVGKNVMKYTKKEYLSLLSILERAVNTHKCFLYLFKVFHLRQICASFFHQLVIMQHISVDFIYTLQRRQRVLSYFNVVQTNRGFFAAQTADLEHFFATQYLFIQLFIGSLPPS